MAVSNNSLFDATTALFVNDIIDESEFVALYDNTKTKSPEFQYWEYQKVEMQLQYMTNDECRSDFRVDLADLAVLAEALRIPEKFVCPNRTVATGMEGLCVALRRFAYPCRFSDMIPRFGRSVSELCVIASEMTDHIYNTHGYLLTDLNQPGLHPDRLQEHANAVHDAGGALENCWGFVDVTVRPICRPGENQRVMYNGHKRIHAIKFQSVVAPNGLIANLYGPIEGKRHDAGMLRMSGLLDQLDQPTGDIINYFKFMDFKKNLKIGLSAVGKMYSVCALLRNALTCFYGSTTSSYFGVDPPTLQEYYQLN
ncbi:Hypothetical predicted protein [Paramuricea clavata]|uniref:Uncharacterized protein n=1 Tax=Paramuricea clavata TaxID=317549 RepID=A0A6S7JLJ6_PARCT|nr:Hypothetical predicted protein [Paramuricea clavata]